MNWHYNQLIVALIVAPFESKHGHSSVSYQWAIYQNYYRCGCESPSGCEALDPRRSFVNRLSNENTPIMHIFSFQNLNPVVDAIHLL